MSRQLWNVVFQNQVWHKTQTLNPANPGMAPEPGSRLGKLFFIHSVTSRGKKHLGQLESQKGKNVFCQTSPRTKQDHKQTNNI